MINNKTFTFIKKVKKMVIYTVQLNQKKLQILIKEKTNAEIIPHK